MGSCSSTDGSRRREDEGELQVDEIGRKKPTKCSQSDGTSIPSRYAHATTDKDDDDDDDDDDDEDPEPPPPRSRNGTPISRPRRKRRGQHDDDDEDDAGPGPARDADMDRLLQQYKAKPKARAQSTMVANRRIFTTPASQSSPNQADRSPSIVTPMQSRRHAGSESTPAGRKAAARVNLVALVRQDSVEDEWDATHGHADGTSSPVHSFRMNRAGDTANKREISGFSHEAAATRHQHRDEASTGNGNSAAIEKVDRRPTCVRTDTWQRQSGDEDLGERSPDVAALEDGPAFKLAPPSSNRLYRPHHHAHQPSYAVNQHPQSHASEYEPHGSPSVSDQHIQPHSRDGTSTRDAYGGVSRAQTDHQDGNGGGVFSEDLMTLIPGMMDQHDQEQYQDRYQYQEAEQGQEPDEEYGDQQQQSMEMKTRWDGSSAYTGHTQTRSALHSSTQDLDTHVHTPHDHTRMGIGGGGGAGSGRMDGGFSVKNHGLFPSATQSSMGDEFGF